MSSLIKTILILISLPIFSLQAETKVFYAKAYREGKLQYKEKHTAEYDKSGKILKAKTEYFDASDKLVAILDSDFSKSITAPDHSFEDFRFKHKHGIKNLNQSIEMFSQDLPEKMQTKVIAIDKSKDQLVVGCQGLAYYFKDYLDYVKKRKNIPIQFLIPGKLDSYEFELKYLNEEANGIVNLEIEIKNWFLKFFAPKLSIKYDKINHRFIKYQGLSNLYDEQKQQLVVDIIYEY